MKKFLSLVLALTLVASLFTVNVMADSTAHTVTITVDKTTELKAGDQITVEVKIDDTLNIEALQYTLVYDTAAFKVDKTKVPPLPTGTPKCFDSTWYGNIKSSTANWGMFLGSPTANCDVDGEIFLGWAGSYGIMDGYNDKDFVIGKFYLTVIDGVADGKYNIGLSTATEGEFNVPVCNTKSTGEDDVAGLISTPVTVTVGEEKQEATPSISTAAPTATGAGIAANREGVEFIYDNAYAVTVKMTNANKATKAGIQFIPAAVLATNGNSWGDASEAVFTTGLGDGEVGYTAALINIPRKFAGQDITMKARGFMVVDGATIVGTEVDSVVNYTVTAEPGQN